METQFLAPFRQFDLDLGLDRSQLLHQRVELRGHGLFPSAPRTQGVTERPPMQLIPRRVGQSKNPGTTCREGCQSPQKHLSFGHAQDI
jgi:hypothetical protein